MRRILLTLPEDTTATDCGTCEHAHAWRCLVFDEELVVHWRNGANAFAGRIPACLAAEAAAARMVEIAPEDAAMDSASLSYPVDREHDARIRDAWNRIETALRAHAAGSGDAEASGGVCDCSRSVGGPHPSCIACNGTGKRGEHG